MTHLEEAKTHLQEAQLWAHSPNFQQLLWAVEEIIKHLEHESPASR